MRKILIVGAGQSGLHLAHGLLSHGYDVTVITGQTSTEIRTGRPAVTQLTYPTVLGYERELNIDFWSSQAPHIETSKLHAYPAPGPAAMTVTGSFADRTYAVSVDRRVKMADWLEYFEDSGGKVVIHGVTLSDLDYFSRMFDLVVVAVGHGELGALFEPDPDRFSGARPRMLVQANIYDVANDTGFPESIGWIGSAAKAGNIWLFPILTADGPCHSLFIADKLAGPIGAWIDKPRPDELWRRMVDLLRRNTPEYYERVRDAELVDGRSTLIQTLTPQVRKAVARLPSGGNVLGIADVVITSDPFAGQGWNNSTRCAKSYLECILERGDRPFDAEFLSGMFERFWLYGYDAELWADTVSNYWEAPPPEHVNAVLGAAATYREAGDRWIQGWNDPSSFRDWLYDPEGARAYLAELSAKYES
ncbi:hypothetical protein HNR23_002777 [Nocardiopsis mwathae]|uniref:Styrene monooxygenase StyA putative substrate binding domain-containing protein n=1 Tax=Nocardiopsis mwathae TaxID=1472723 RepID=A0A7W9YIG9_9ACTN|nr:styrene monooxygenase/indole monooxygenase family protein [Nocardiopsis mwathae]MBB6172717.1 hypothetical protein [Nocardiopsis mwathae]